MNPMKQNSWRSERIVISCALLVCMTVFTGCGGSFFVDPTLTGIQLSPANPFVQSGRTQQMKAIATYSDGTSKIVTGSANWTSNDAKVANVSASGMLSGLITGSATISVFYQSVTGSTRVTVSAAPLTSIEVSPATASVRAGQTLRYTATGTFLGGATQNVTGNVVWTASDTSVATVSGGVATTKSVPAIRQTQIYASSGSTRSEPVILVVYPQ